MDANDIMNAINGILDIGDTLDNSGIGVKALTNGKNTTRELCQMELGAFLLYIGDGAPSFTDAQATLVNLLLAQQFGMTPAWKMKSVAAELDRPDPDHNVTYQAFAFADEAIAQQQGKPAGTQLRDSIVSLYDTFGGMMVAVNENPISRMRYNNYMSGLKAQLSGSTGFSAASSSVSAPVSSGSVPAADIEQYIPAGVTLTDNQRGYLAGVVGAMDMFGKRHVTTSQVAIFMKKDNSAVSSGVRTLVKKGILDINDDAEIVIAEKKPAGVSAGKAKTGAKTAATKKTSAGKTAKYNDQVSFELSREYEMAWDKDKDGNDVCKIVSVKRADGDSDNPETTVLVSVIENNDPNKDQFDKLQEGDDKSTFIPLDSDPEGLLCITYLDMQILSMNFRTSLYRLFMKLSPKETLLLFLTSTSSGGENKFFEDFTRLSEIWRFVRINGEACDLGSAGEAGTFAEYMKELADNEGKPKKKKTAAKKAGASGAKAAKKEKKIIRTKPAKFPDAEQYKDIHQVEDEAERVTPMGTWSVPVPPGCSYTMDPDCAGGGFSGKYPLQIQRTEDCDFDRAYDSAFSFAVFASGARLDAFSALTDLSTDEAADAMTEMASKADAAYSFFKRTSALAIMTKEAPSEKNGYALIFLIFSRGMQLVDNGQIVVRGNAKKKAREEAEAFLNSISPMSRPDGDAGYKPVVISERFGLTYHDQKTLTIDDCITLPVPDGFKASTDQNLIVSPRKFSIVPKDYPDFSKAMEAAVGITAVPMQGDIPEYKPGICDKVCGIIVSQFEQQNIFVQNAPRIVAQQTTKGIIFYQKIFDNQTMQCSVAKAILWTGKHGYIMSFAINYGEKIADRTDVSNDSWQIMSDWMNRIQLPGDKLYYVPSESDSGQEADRIGDLVSPPPPEELHEHFDLITNGGYTTHRDADFIGQSIRGLMEKCGSAGEDAYDEMKIAGDAYDLDQSALKLAQVFRLDESLFEPYKDREALIRLSVFSDVRMLHALRSLSWMVSRYSDKEKRPISKITFDELHKMGRIIEKKKYLNYDGSSGFVNLCNHYDWHVFYVPEKYRDGSTAMTTDLRYLTGKENRGGNTMSVFIPGISDISSMNRKNNIISRNEETLESLDALRKDLKDLLPVMEAIHDGLLEDRDRSKALEGPLADALTAWCALAVAAKEPFYSEEAADTPEADAALEAPPERPKDKLDEKPVKEAKPTAKKAAPKDASKPAAKTTTKESASKKAAAKKEPAAEKKPEEPGTVLELNGETVIRDKQFEGYKGASHLIIPEGVTEIGKEAFYQAEFEKVTLPKTLKTINECAFLLCQNLETVVIPEGLETMGPGAFLRCPKLKEITLPDSLKEMSGFAFSTVVFPHKDIVINMSEKLGLVLARQKSKTSIYLEGRIRIGGKKYKSLIDFYDNWKKNHPDEAEPAVVLDLEGKTRIAERQFANYMDADDLIIPEGVTEIGPWAFNNSEIKSIVLPKSLKKISECAFWRCKKLKTINFPDGLEAIGEQAFIGCEALEEVHLPDSIKKIAPLSFALSDGAKDAPVIGLSSKMAIRLGKAKPTKFGAALYARRFKIDGDYFKSLKEFVEFWEKNEAVEKEWAEKESNKAELAAKKPDIVADRLFESNSSLAFRVPAGFVPDPPEERGSPDSVAVRYGKKEKKSGYIVSISWEYTAVITTVNCNAVSGVPRQRGETPIQMFKRTEDPSTRYKEGFSDIPAVIYAQSQTLNLYGKHTVCKVIGIVVQTDPDHYVRILDAIPVDDLNEEKETKRFGYLLAIAGGLVINGIPFDVSRLDPKALVKEFAMNFDPSASEDDGFMQAISFVPTAGFTCVRSVGVNNRTTIRITLDGCEGESGSIDGMFKAALNLLPGETPLEAIHRGDRDMKPNGGWIRLSDDPKAELHLMTKNGGTVKLVSLLLYIQIREKPGLTLTVVNTGWYDDDMDWNMKAYRLMAGIIRMIRVYGKPLPDHGITGEILLNLLRPDFDHPNTGKGEVRISGGASVPATSSGTEKSGTVVNAKGAKSSSVPKTGSASVAKQKTEPVNDNVRILNVGGARVIEGTDYMADTDPRPMVIPEGVVRIDDSVFSHCHMESVTLPRTMRTLGHHVFSTCENLKKVELNEGLEEIDAFIVSDCPKMTEITLPDSIRKIDNDAFLAEFSVTNPVSHITVKLSGKLARYLVANNEYPDIPALRAREFVVDGERYKSLEEYVRRAPKQERNRTVSTGGNGASEEQKQHERNALINRITALEKERDSLGGLFAGLKRKKLQREIDDLKDQLRRL